MSEMDLYLKNRQALTAKKGSGWYHCFRSSLG